MVTREEFGLIWDMMTPLQRAILAVLHEHHRGMANAIHVADLARLVGVHSRKLQDEIKDLTEIYGVPIAASLPCGIFIMETEEERAAVAAHLRARAISTLTRAQAIKRISREQFDGECEAGGQGRLF